MPSPNRNCDRPKHKPRKTRGKGLWTTQNQNQQDQEVDSPIAGVSSWLVDEARMDCFGQDDNDKIRLPQTDEELEKFLTHLPEVVARHQRS